VRFEHGGSDPGACGPAQWNVFDGSGGRRVPVAPFRQTEPLPFYPFQNEFPGRSWISIWI
jgi:hypothetical protein